MFLPSDMKVTLDTNVLPADELIASVPPGLFEFSIVSVTDREMGGLATQEDCLVSLMDWLEFPLIWQFV